MLTPALIQAGELRRCASCTGKSETESVKKEGRVMAHMS